MESYNQFVESITKSDVFQKTLREEIIRLRDEVEVFTVPEPVLYCRAETARILRISLPTLDRYTNLKLIEGKKVGNRILYSKECIETALRSIPARKYQRV
jgi:hypothetical protein